MGIKHIHALNGVRHSNTYLNIITPAVPAQGARDMRKRSVDVLPSSELLVVRREHYTILASLFCVQLNTWSEQESDIRLTDAYPVVREGVGRMEVENEEETATFKNDHLVPFVFERHVRL